MDLWLSTWDEWRPHISTWLGSIEEMDLHHLGRLRIPSSLIEHIPAEEKHHMRWQVAWHQYHMLLGVTHLRRERMMPPRVETDDPLPSQVPETPWFSKLKAHRVTLNLAKKNLQEECQYKVPKKKRKAATAAATHAHQKKAQAVLTKPLTHTTKVEAIKVLTNLPPTSSALRVQLERHLGHRPEDLPLPKEVGQALSQALEERQTLANTLLQNRHYTGGMPLRPYALVQAIVGVGTVIIVYVILVTYKM